MSSFIEGWVVEALTPLGSRYTLRCRTKGEAQAVFDGLAARMPYQGPFTRLEMRDWRGYVVAGCVRASALPRRRARHD